MSQNKVYQGLKQIGGEGSSSDLRDHLEEKYPDSTLPEYCMNRLRQLEEKDVVEVDDTQTPYYVKLIDENWAGVQDSLAERDFPPKSTDE